MTSKEIKSIRVNHGNYPMDAEDFVPYASRLIYRDQIIYPKPKISGYTIGEMLTDRTNLSRDDKFILMSYDGIMLNSLKDGYNDMDKYIPLGEVKENSDLMIVTNVYPPGSDIFNMSDINGHFVKAFDCVDFRWLSVDFVSDVFGDDYYYPCSKTSYGTNYGTKKVYWDTSYNHVGDVHGFYFYKLIKN